MYFGEYCRNPRKGGHNILKGCTYCTVNVKKIPGGPALRPQQSS